MSRRGRSTQVVRGNLRELWDLDLQGHAYGYTPFCDSRKETLGYQFWRSGYWKDHLRGKPYHISAVMRKSRSMDGKKRLMSP